jgi:hypothetical protein
MTKALDTAALDFAQYCLKQPDSFIDGASRFMHVRPDGFNTGPEAFADCESLDCEDLRLVLPLVAYWCSLNNVTLEITAFNPSQYQCRFTEHYEEAHSVRQIIETTGSADLCCELLSGAAYLAQKMTSVETARPSRSWAQFVKDKQ